MKSKIKLSSGEVITIIPFRMNIQKIKKQLEQSTGLKFGYGHLYYQAIGMLNAYVSFRTLNYRGSEKVIANIMHIMAYGLGEMEGGIVCLDRYSKELLVYVPHPSRYHYIIRFQNWFQDMIKTSNWNYMKTTEIVETVEGTFAINDLNRRLKNALKEEDYEMAAKLRDEISKKDKEE